MPQPTALNGTADGLVSSGNATALSNSGNAYWFTSGSLGTLNNQAIRTDQFAIDDFGRFFSFFARRVSKTCGIVRKPSAIDFP